MSLNLNGVCVAARGLSGGLALLWQRNVHVSLQNFSVNHTDADIFDEEVNISWCFTGFYGNPDNSLRYQSWNLLRQLAALSCKPWLCAGDFNAVLSNSEKSGGNLPSFRNMQEFSGCLRDTRLNDLGFVGYPFTWANNRKIPFTTRERLDRACGNPEWMELFPNYRVLHLDALASDHLPILIELKKGSAARHGRHNRGFKFEAMWLKAEECEQIIKESWFPSLDQHNRSNQWSNLENCKVGLLRWSRDTFGGVSKRIKKLKEEIVKKKKGDLTDDASTEISQMSKELEELLDREEMMWRQRAKAHWVREGDKNTRFSHAKASSRRKNNTISGLCNSQGVWCEKKEDMENIVSDYFQSLFSSKNPSTTAMEEVLDAIEPRVSETMNGALAEKYTPDEVKKALDGMHPLKSPGPDGFPVVFYQRFWSIIGKYVTSWVLGLLNHKEIPVAGNFTHIVLIPKCTNPKNMTQFRPISLSNVVYKIASKAIVNRLKLFMNDIISESQSAFVPSRLISDNILVAYEVVHYMKRSKAAHMAIKLDMSKAYDRVEWIFVRRVMSRLGFSSGFVDLIMLCVSSVTYSFVLNGRSFGFLAPERGLRQGDPISPYLFLFCTEALSALIKREGNLAGLAVCNRAPEVSHLFFADDTMIFCNANVSCADSIKNVLKIYEEASGQMVNYSKSSIAFSTRTSQEDIDLVCSKLPMAVVDKHDKYLGLPSGLGKSKREAFANIRDRVCHRLQGWKEKWLSKGGKEILIKGVIQAIPSYAMSCFRLPRYFTEEIEMLMAKFWWEDSKGKGVHWARWKELCNSKEFGGLGFRDLYAFNTALLAKQVWRLLDSPHSLLGKIYKARYYPNSDIFGSSLGANPSYTWRSIWGAIELVEKGTRWRIGNGAKVNIWSDKWLPRERTFRIFTPRNQWPENMKVQSLIDGDMGIWNMQIITSIFDIEDKKYILSIPLGSSSNEDRIIWHYNKNGEFSVRSAYHFAVSIEKEKASINIASGSSSAPVVSWKWLWNLNKIKIFLWRCCKNLLPNRQNLVKRKVIEDNLCEICKACEEDVLHCLSLCTLARQVWALSGVSWSNYWPNDQSTTDWLLCLKKKLDKAEFEYCVVICWAIWSARNKKLFEDATRSALDIVVITKNYLMEVRGSASMVLKPRQSMQTSRIRWNAPLSDEVKINFDASLSSPDSGCGLGGLARSADGMCLAWFSTCCRQFLDPTSAEAMAALKAIEFARDHHWEKIVLESDSSIIVAAIEREMGARTTYGHIVDDIKRLASTFEVFKIRHVKREANRAAHAIAKLSCRDSCMLSVLPSFITDIVSSDFLS